MNTQFQRFSSGPQNARLLVEHPKILSNFPFPSKRNKASTYVNKPLQKVFKPVYIAYILIQIV